MKPLIGESPKPPQSVSVHSEKVHRRRAHISAPHSAASLVRSRSCRALSACLSRAFRCLRALLLRSLSPSAWPRAPPPPLTPSLAPLSRRPLPARARAAPVRAPVAPTSFCALACRHVLLRLLFAALSHRPPTSPRALPAPPCSAKMPKECGIKFKVKVDGHVKPAGKSCGKHIEHSESSCGTCHAIKGDGTRCTGVVKDARSNFCATYHLDFVGK